MSLIYCKACGEMHDQNMTCGESPWVGPAFGLVQDKPDNREGQRPPDGSVIEGYIPEIWSVRKDVIYAAIQAVKSGLDYARECLTSHDTALGRTTHKNKTCAETIERDIQYMERTLEMLRACGPNAQRERPAEGRR